MKQRVSAEMESAERGGLGGYCGGVFLMAFFVVAYLHDSALPLKCLLGLLLLGSLVKTKGIAPIVLGVLWGLRVFNPWPYFAFGLLPCASGLLGALLGAAVEKCLSLTRRKPIEQELGPPIREFSSGGQVVVQPPSGKRPRPRLKRNG